MSVKSTFAFARDDHMRRAGRLRLPWDQTHALDGAASQELTRQRVAREDVEICLDRRQREKVGTAILEESALVRERPDTLR